MSYSKDDFYIGQRVRVRDWDNMGGEYGIIGDVIDTPYHCFPSGMRPLCGKTAEIFDIGHLEREGAYRVWLCNWEDNNRNPTTLVEMTGFDTWAFSTAMFIPLESEPELKFSFDSEAFNQMLGVT